MLHHQKKSCNDKRQPTFLESERLRHEIEDLEDALILHARFQSESDNSVKEMIRKELGTTRWEHGGEGKLTTYRSGKDLCNQGMKVHHFGRKKAKDRKKQCAVSGDRDEGRPKMDKENSKASTCASADKQVRKLKKVKSTLELRDIMSDVEKMSELKITSFKATAAIKESCEMTFDTADVKQGATMTTPSLKDEISAKRKVKSSMKIKNYSSKLYVNTVERKQSKASYNNSIPESSNVLDTCKITAKEMTKTGRSVFDKKAVSHLFTQDTGDNFKSVIQSSFNSSDTSNVVTKSKLKTQELDGRKDTDKTLMSEAVNHTNVSDSNTFINDLLNNDYEYSKSNMLVGNVCNKNNRDDSRFLSSNQDKRISESQNKRVSTNQDRRVSENQDQRVDKKDKWAEKNNGVLFIDSDYIRVPCSSCTDDGGGDNFTDFDALEDPQASLHEGYEHACLSNPDSCQKDKQQNETNEKMLSFTDSFNMFSTTRKEVQPSVTSQTNIKADNVNISSELVSSLRKCLNYEQVDSRSLQAVSHTDMSVIQQGIVSDISSSLPETEFPQGKPSHDEDVESWLHSLGLDSVEHYVQLFHDHQLDMSRVHFLSASDLREMGIHGIGPIMKIMKGITVTAHKSHLKEKIQVKETNGRSMRRQKQLQDSEFSRTSVGQRNEKAGLDITSLDVCKVQSDLNVLETQSAEPNIQTLQQHCLDENSLEMPRCLQSVELGQVNNYRSDSELASPISATRSNAQERKQQKDNTRSSHVIAEDKPVSVKVYTNGDDQSHKLPGQGQFRRVNESLRERNSQNLISCVAVGDGVIAINSAEIQKETTVAQPVTLMATTHLLKSQRSRHSSARSKDNGQIRRQQSRQSEKYKRVGSSPNYILDSIKKVELNRNDVVFSETDLLGSGTFSQVFKGTYKGSEVAVKRLQIPLQTRDLSYFVSGISILQELRHPHVAMLLGVCSRGHESPLIVMEFLACGNLHTWLHAPGRTYLKRDEFYQIARDVSAGMLYLHHHQPAVLHLDLKPKNILIGHGTRAKVADFGFTKLRLQDDVKPHRTLESPSWMAPELFTSGEITPKADVYSFAMVLWEMLTRQCPYDNFSIFQILEHVHTNRRPTLPSDCPKGLSQIIQKCWSQKPAARPGFKEILKCLEQLSQICEWITSSETAVKPGNEVMSLNCTQEYSRITEYSLKEGLLKAEEKTSDIDHIDLISLSSQDYEESKSCNDDEGECLQDPQGNVPERSRFCDTISLTDIRNGIHAFNDRKSSLSCTDVEQQRLSSQFSCNSSRSCLSLPDNEKDSGKMRHNTPDQLNEMCFISQKPSISVSKSQDNLQSSMSVRKLLPLRHSLNRSKIMQASLHGKRCTPQRFLNHQTKSQIGHHFLDENLPDRMFKYVDTSSDSMKDPALVGSRELMKGQDTLDCISVNEDELLAPCSDTLNYVPSFHDKVAPVRLTTGQEASELQAGCCHESSNNDQHGNDLKELLICSHVETQSVNMFMKSQRENIDCASIKAHEIKSGACDLDTDSTKRCRMHVMKIDSQTHIVSPLGQSTMCSVVSNTHKSKQLEADTHHFLDNNIAYEKENSLDRKMADVCLPASSTRFSNIQTSTKSSNIQASTKSKNIQTASVGSDNITASPRSDDIQSASVGSDNITASPRSDDIQSASVGSANITTSPKSDDIQTASVGSANITTSPRSDDIQSASVGSANITTSPRSDDIQNASVGSNNITTSSAPDDIQTSTKSGNIPTHYVKCYSPQIPVVPENVHIPSSRSNNIQALDTPGDTDGFNEVIKNCTEPNNYRTPSIHAHETTTYESDSDSSTVSDISQDSLNKDTAVRPRAVRISDHGVLTRSSALAMTADIILKNKIHNLPIADDKNTESSSAYNPCLTCKQGLNAHHTCLQSEQENINNLTELSSIDAEAIKFNKIHNTDDHRSLCLWSEVHKSYHVNSFALTKSHAKTLQEEMLPREKQKPNLTEPKKDPQVEEAAKHYLMTIPSCQKRNFLTERQLDIGNHTSDMAHKANKAKDILPLHSKQIFKHSEGTSRFSIDANILLAQKKLLKPVVVTASSLSVNTLDDSEGRSPTVITILKKAMTDRRFAMGDILGSQDVTPETSWSLEG